MSLDPSQFQEFHEALLDAFDGSELRTLVRIHLGRRLDVIAGGDTLSAITSSLIEWAERHGCISALIKGAQKQNPQNPLLRAFVNKYRSLTIENIIEEDQTTIEITVKGSPDKAILEHLLKYALSLPDGTIKITKMTPVNSTKLTIELPKSKVLSLYSMAKNGILEDVEVLTVSLTRADLIGANLIGADLTRADLTFADLRGADLRGADLSSADLSSADLSGADLTRAILRSAHLSGANLIGANLIGAALTGADLTFAFLRSANLIGASLIGANLIGADLSGANLTFADLRSADLSGADLRGADLIGADLTRAILIDVKRGESGSETPEQVEKHLKHRSTHRSEW